MRTRRRAVTRREWLSAAVVAAQGASSKAFVRVSQADRRYFELSEGSPYIPIGNNICWERTLTEERAVLAKMEERYRALAANGGNFTRLWLSSPFYDIEPGRPGEFDAAAARHLEQLLAIARRHGIRVKLCLEHFRSMEYTPPLFPGSVSMSRPEFGKGRGGPFADMTKYFTSAEGRAAFLRKLDFYAKTWRDEPAIFGWELWNEINAVRGTGWMEWTRAMLPELKRRFPRHLAMQSLGSFDRESAREFYRPLCTAEGNEVAQVHRYLDLGAQLEVCKGPMDVLAADAVRELRSYEPGRPVVLAEVGAVEPKHAGPWKLYERDSRGVLLHDLLFAPFFAGAAGPGQAWHWDHYVEKHDLWWHFARFAEAVKGIDPRGEQFEPVFSEEDSLRIYTLRGRKNTLIWVRDAGSDWRTEIADGRAAAVRRGARVRVSGSGEVRVYDPWRNVWSRGAVGEGMIALPEFQRSLVIRVRRSA
jgi:hypothetical protein